MPEQQQWSPSILDAFNVFRLHCRSQRYRDSSIEFHDRRLPQFVQWLAEQYQTERLDAVTANHIRAYYVAKLDAGASDHYVHSIARALRTFFRFCVREEMLCTNPMRNVPMPKTPRQILPAYSPSEVRALLKSTTDNRDRAILLMLLDTGARASELIALRGGDVDIKTGEVKVREGKGGKARSVYAGSKTMRTLLRYYMQRGEPKPGKAIWVAERKPHAPLTYSGLAQLLRRLGQTAGVTDCTAHKFRRTFAVQCLRNGMNIYSLQRLMGHADIDVLRQYLDLLDEDMADAHAKFGVVDNL